MKRSTLLLAAFMSIIVLHSKSQEMGTFTDSRDGHIYKTVKIGSQTWMAENLAFRTEGGDYYAYGEKIKNIEKYGYLYDYKMAVKACPSGWHLPYDSDWTKLSDFLKTSNVAGPLGYEDVVGIKLRTYDGWKPSKQTKKRKKEEFNTCGFSALPGGYLLYNNLDTNKFGGYKYLGEQCIWWAQPNGGGNALIRRIYDYSSVFERSGAFYGAFSVRCIEY